MRLGSEELLETFDQACISRLDASKSDISNVAYV